MLQQLGSDEVLNDLDGMDPNTLSQLKSCEASAGCKLLAWGLNKTNACGQLHINDHISNASQYAYNADEDKTTIPLEVFQPTESRAFSRMEKRALGLSAGSDTTIVIVKKSVE